MDVCAAGFKAAAAMLDGSELETALRERYAGWESAAAKKMLNGDLETAAARVEAEGLDPEPRSGGQERLEMIVNRYVY